jgi:ubiquinone/menaquinone biosynthesis C-methylase UbiE
MALIQNVIARIKDGTFIERCVVRLRPRPPSGSGDQEEPAGDSYYGERAENYLATRLKQEYWHQEQEVFQEILQALPRDLRVLDVPFGTGRFVPFYLEHGFKIHGLDSSEDMIAVASKELGAEFSACEVVVADALDLPFEDQYFDLIVSFRFLSHIVSASDARLILKEFHRVCRKQVMIQLRVRRGDALAIDPPSGDQTYGDRLTYAQVEAELQAAGFRIKREWKLEERETYGRSVFLCERN